MSEQFEQLKAQLEKEDTIVKGLRVVSSPEFGWGLDAAAIGQVVIGVALVSFAEAVAGKLADDSWDLLKRAIKAVIRRLGSRKSQKPEPISVVYSSEIKGIALEVLLQYRDHAILAKDVRNHQQYLSLAFGFASAQGTPVKSGVSLLSLLTARGDVKPSGFILRPKSPG